MFLIFGLRTKDRFHSSPVHRCDFCGVTAAQSLIERTTKFSLFFIPLFPVRPSRWIRACTHCGGSREISRREAVAAA
ncbi:zinc-ribbon domain-containing protein [Actinoplanes sp. NPDC049548]|uniref:zinc-ribbon domain-containing protein n=1 Tax=Actinoplanes sp. NPDC049548 TaxID=3155152 RepID=UPI003425CCA7